MYTYMPTRDHPRNIPLEASWMNPCPEPRNEIRRETTSLPPIRKAFPELGRDVQRDVLARTPPSATSSGRVLFSGTKTPPQYIYSPTGGKRRRLSADVEGELGNQIPRLYALPQKVLSRPHSPTPKPLPAFSPWADSDRSGSYTRNVAMPSTISPVPIPIRTRERAEGHQILPNFPLLNLDRVSSEVYRGQGYAGDEYIPESSRRPSLAPSGSHCVDVGGQAYRPGVYAYSYHHPHRHQSLSDVSAHADRTPFSPGPYGPHLQESFMRVGDFSMGANGDSKQRKRRGNLPKETTDKLRTWFMGHLVHPYPTEDEKQDLMRQTGLQMNQISNWFINARRRQLPTMVSNARAEKAAMNGHTVDSKALASSERTDYDGENKPRSDSESSNFENLEMDPAKRSQNNGLKRGSV